MGVIFSCCNVHSGDDEEQESLLRSQHENNNNGDPNSDSYDALLQRQLELQEQKRLTREKQLRDIVTDTNDKLIDISMVSNSGIVIQSDDNDIFRKAALEDSAITANTTVSNEDITNNTQKDNNVTSLKKSKYTVLNPDEHLTDKDKERLQSTLRNVLKEIEEQVHIEVPGKLTVTI
ncbi:Meh1p NDAI_0K01970 [Naumovozyma dairenensis CBS 421]|uniref:Uncharacterized protein n=1 Tax=Naumovozyma dairenensis (strain ATCC 10597 / BCRC 20456 / CBS 421 / NBRC 0211 / NRRL Y-12639) TaxID=1071378 RepID=G0WHX7_NAUDC|nr:hypothetical protein NDAI_0K01970 [Naumovozyma dairenensis CBS 421]CCD27388.1 hypothetical protein NDAI_0K01970 [Naumovozyma dairenensis CBS 421]